MDASDDMLEKWHIWLDIADIWVFKNSPSLLDLFPDIPPPTNLSDGIRSGSTEAEDFSSCFLEENNELAAVISQWAKENPDQILPEEMRSIKLRRSAVEQATKRLGKRELLNLILDQVEYQHRFKIQNAGYPNLNPNLNLSLSLDLNPAPNNQPIVPSRNPNLNPFSQEQVYSRGGYRVNNPQFVLIRNPAAKEARNVRIACRRLQRGLVGNYAASRSGKGQEEPGLKLLLKTVLNKDDVGSLGRIVLPKKGAEDHLPVHESRSDGIVIAVKDLNTSRVWKMRFRFRSEIRKYVFENTGDFVRANGLQVGDFIMLYRDTKTGKYMILPIKMPAEGMKPPSRRSTKYKRRPQFGHCKS